jgi:hypothetical protein
VDEPSDSSVPNWPEFRRLFAYDNLLGKVLEGRYEIVRRLGAGGMGVVFLARHIHLDKHFALKIISPRFLDDPEIAQRFLLEARAASKIDHANVVSITDFGPPEDGPAFFAMEHLEGEDLSRLLAREGPLPWRRAVPIVQQIARALVAAHQRGVVHRDIKPQNCFRITRDDNPDFIKVLDFGLAKVLSGTAGKSAWTVGGSPGYIAPEIYRGGATDHRVDLFALGVLLHALLIGRVPAQKPGDVDLPPGAPVLYSADLAEPLRRFLARATHEDPDQRHASAEVLLADLEATRRALERPVAPRRRWPLVVGVASATALIVGMALQAGFGVDRPIAAEGRTAEPAEVAEVRRPVHLDRPVVAQSPATPAVTSAPPIASEPAPVAAVDAPVRTAPEGPVGPVKAKPRPPAPFDEDAARALLQRQGERLAACKAGSSFRGVATRVRLDGVVTVTARGKASVTLPAGYDVNGCVERLVEGLAFKPSATGGSFGHVFML